MTSSLSTIEHLAATCAATADARRNLHAARDTFTRNRARSKLTIALRRKQLAGEKLDLSSYR